MKNILLIGLATSLLSTAGLAQSSHPVNTAFVSPNPVESKAMILFEEPVFEELSVVIKDLTGKILYQFKPDTRGEECRQINLDMVESLRRGIYIVQITSHSGKVKTLKIQKT